MKRIRLICMMAVVAIVTAVCCSFTSREDRNHFAVYTDPNSHMNVYRVSVAGRVYYVLHNTTQGGLCKLQ